MSPDKVYRLSVVSRRVVFATGAVSTVAAIAGAQRVLPFELWISLFFAGFFANWYLASRKAEIRVRDTDLRIRWLGKEMVLGQRQLERVVTKVSRDIGILTVFGTPIGMLRFRGMRFEIEALRLDIQGIVATAVQSDGQPPKPDSRECS